jgi:hypothetical protein
MSSLGSPQAMFYTGSPSMFSHWLSLGCGIHRLFACSSVGLLRRCACRSSCPLSLGMVREWTMGGAGGGVRACSRMMSGRGGVHSVKWVFTVCGREVTKPRGCGLRFVGGARVWVFLIREGMGRGWEEEREGCLGGASLTESRVAGRAQEGRHQGDRGAQCRRPRCRLLEGALFPLPRPLPPPRRRRSWSECWCARAGWTSAWRMPSTRRRPPFTRDIL